ncbi:MAG: transposase [Candidatus Aenigmatarchaeota archaeon]
MEEQKTFFCERCNRQIKIPRNYIGKPNAEEKARAKHNHKMHSLILGVKFKIYPEKQDIEKLNQYFTEYGKAVTFAAKIIDKLMSKFKFQGEKDKEKNKFIFPIDKCDFCNKEKEIYYQNNQGEKICRSCYSKEFNANSIRKKIYATKGRKVNPSFNIKNVTKILAKTHYNYVIRDAFQLLNSLKKQRKKRIKKLQRDKAKLRLFEEMLMYEDKRFELPKKKGWREPRFIHISQKDKAEELKGYTINKIRDNIKILRRNIEREERSLRKKSPILFKGNRILLSQGGVKFDFKNNKVRIPLSKELKLTKYYEFSGPRNIVNRHGKEFFEKKLKQIQASEPKYAYLIRKQINKDKKNPIFDYYLQYAIEIIPEFIEDYNGVLGIDRGINTLACVVFLEKGKDRPSFVKFFSGKEIIKLKNQRRKQLYFLIGKHNKRRKQKKIRPIAPKINQILHVISKQIVALAQEKKAAIALEALEKPKKSRYRQSRHLKYKLSLFVFKKLSDYINYKAKREGIKVILVPPEKTSKNCSHCAIKGDIHEDTQRPYKNSFSLFKCNKCGVELNADYNAAFNIAQKGLNSLNPNLKCASG